jgi:hypothetical protein
LVGAVVGILEVILLALVAISLLSTLLSHSADDRTGAQDQDATLRAGELADRLRGWAWRLLTRSGSPHEKWVFWDRREAGRLLAERLSGYRDEKPIVLALPRGAWQWGTRLPGRSGHRTSSSSPAMDGSGITTSTLAGA